MHTHRTRSAGSCARRLGLDRNPLRRGTDRIEAVVRLLTLIVLVVAVPVAAVTVGRQTDHAELRQAHAQRATEHLVNAVLLEQAQATGIPAPYTSVQLTWVLARWQPPGLPARSGEVLAPAGAPKGSIVPIWVNASGTVTDPPTDDRTIVGDVCIAVTVTCIGSVLVLLGLGVLTRGALDRRRLRAWDAEWRATGPLWSGHRSLGVPGARTQERGLVPLLVLDKKGGFNDRGHRRAGTADRG